MNNKGFAISGILYGVLMLFLMLLLSLLNVLVTRINRLTSLVNEVNNSVEDIRCASSDSSCPNRIYYDDELNDSDTLYTTKVRGKYILKVNNSIECSLYLPKNISLVVDNRQIKYVKSVDGVIDIHGSVKNVINGSNCGTNVNKFKVVKIYSSTYNR